MGSHKIVRVTVTEINDEKFEGAAVDISVPWLCTPLTHFSDYRVRSRDYYGWVRWAQHRRSGSGNRPAVSPRSRSGIEMGSASCAPLVKWDITEVLNNSA